MDELPFWWPHGIPRARVAEQPYQSLAVTLLLSQPLLQTLAIISFSLITRGGEGWCTPRRGVSYSTDTACKFQI